MQHNTVNETNKFKYSGQEHFFINNFSFFAMFSLCFTFGREIILDKKKRSSIFDRTLSTCKATQYFDIVERKSCYPAHGKHIHMVNSQAFVQVSSLVAQIIRF